MEVPLGADGYRESLADLQTQSVRVISFLTSLIGYVWLFRNLWMTTISFDPNRPATHWATWGSWLGVACLLGGTLICQAFRVKHLRLAKLVLVAALLLSTAGAVMAFASDQAVYLFIAPVVFAGVLLSQPAFLAVAGIAEGLILLTSIGRATDAPSVSLALLPMATVGLVTIASWLSVHNLHTALAWALGGYERARQKEGQALSQQGELRRVLKALDEATGRLERANHMLALARDQAEEARRLKQEFAQSISHELRTPLNLIVGFTELMVQSPEYYGGTLSPAAVRDLGIVHRNARHLQNLVSDVLDLARIEMAQMSVLPEETDPAVLVREATETMRGLVEARGLALATEVPAELPKLWVDPTRIRQVLINLLNNAVRFTDAGEIRVQVQHQGQDVLFSVTDTGIGIAEEDIPRIFEEFRQLDGSTNRRHGGAGLGLAISRKFVELHGGRIWVESRVAIGSTFTFTVPVLPARLDLILAEDSLRRAQVQGGASLQESVVLVVSRSPSAAGLLARYVRGTRTVVVRDCQQAQEAARQLMPQVVLLDQACQPLTSAELQRLGASWGLPSVPFISCPLPGEEMMRQQLAVDGYMVKPISRESLWDVLRRFGERVDRVLVIDDDRDFVRLLGRMLEGPIRRYQVASAYNGQEALAMMDYRRPDLVLLDLKLPDMDGPEVLAQIRAHAGWQDIPVVIITAQDDVDDRRHIEGTLMISRSDGLQPGEVVRWVQAFVGAPPGGSHFPPSGEVGGLTGPAL